MTSRNSFFNLMKEDFKRRLWVFILASLVFFATFIVAFTMYEQNIADNYYALKAEERLLRMSNRICDFVEPKNVWFAIVAVVGAIISGVSGFSFLHSKKQVDFYHSMPVKREKLFLVRFVNGLLMYAVPYLVGLLYAFLITAMSGFMTQNIFVAGMAGFAIHFMGYTVMYLVSILAVMLTGKLLITFFGIVVLNLYAPAIYGLWVLLRETFFVTAYDSQLESIVGVMGQVKWLSPMCYYIDLVERVYQDNVNYPLELLGFLAVAALLCTAIIFVYKLRKSEAAGRSMAFQVTEPVIRVMIAVPVGILAGLLFYYIQYAGGQSSQMFWLIFGTLLGAFLAHGIIESFYQGDVKKCLSHRWQLLGSMVAAVAIPLLFVYDITGFDSYLPKKSEIESMAIGNNEFGVSGRYQTGNGSTVWGSSTYALQHMELTDFDAAYALAEKLVESTKQTRKESFFGIRVLVETIYAVDDYESDFVIKYQLKSGHEVYRRYSHNLYDVLEEMEALYNNEEYKLASHPLYSLANVDYSPVMLIGYVPATDSHTTITRGLTEIIAAYSEEYIKLDFDDITQVPAIGELEFCYMLNDALNFNGVGVTVDSTTEYGNYNYSDSMTLLVYPSMTKTLELLKRYGCDMAAVPEVSDIYRMDIEFNGTVYNLLGDTEELPEAYVKYEDEITDWDEYYKKYGMMPVGTEYISISITDPKEMEECLKYVAPRRYFTEFGPFPKWSIYCTVTLYCRKNTTDAVQEETWAATYRFKEDAMPQFVTDRLLENMSRQAQ